MARRGLAGRGSAGQGKARLGKARHGKPFRSPTGVRSGIKGEHGTAGRGWARRGVARQGMDGGDWCSSTVRFRGADSLLTPNESPQMWQITSFEFRGNVFGSFASMALTLRYNDGSRVETSYEFPVDAKPHHLRMVRNLYYERREMANSAGVNVTERMSEAFKTLINKGA